MIALRATQVVGLVLLAASSLVLVAYEAWRRSVPHRRIGEWCETHQRWEEAR